LHTDSTKDHVRYVLSETQRALSDHPKIETNTIRVRLAELTSSAINIELVSYVLTRNFDEFAAVREELLLQIMNLVEDSGTSLASSQKVYLSSDPASPKQKNSENKIAIDTPQQAAVRNSAQGDGKNAKQ
jgi:MscS family membrane protein